MENQGRSKRQMEGNYKATAIGIIGIVPIIPIAVAL